jgi:predicted Zn-dependent protease
MSTTVETLFQEALERYRNGEAAATLIPVFKEICDRSAKSPVPWTCLAWLYLLEDNPKKALEAAKKSVKLHAQDAQAQVNLALALLDLGRTGVRTHIEIVQQIMLVDEDSKKEVLDSIEDGFKRKPDWKSLKRIQKYLTE